ncbi:MAG TPA: HAD family hydrolase [Acidobacteriota bacterium]|nr:HAD family hydrolase [Acidobacteriota bacterium]
MNIEGIFFDLYGTLIIYGDMERAWKDWLSTIHTNLREAGLSLSIDELAHACEGFFRSEISQTQFDGLTVYERRLKRLCDDLNIQPDREILRKTAETSLAAWQRYISPDPGAASLLADLRNKYKLALVTNFDHPPHLHQYLPTTGLAEVFDVIVISAEVGVRKPSPGIFEIALERTGLDASNVIYVGDSPADDVPGALEAGIKPVLISRSGSFFSNDFEAPKEKTDATSVTLGYNQHQVEIISSLSDLYSLLMEVSE